MVAWHLPTRSAISPGFAPFAYISSIIRRSSSFKHSYFIASPPFLRKKISASELISSFALNDKRHTIQKIAFFPLTFAANSCKLFHVVKRYNFTEGVFAVKNQTYRMTMLFDFYGELLTDRQKEFFDLYYNEDLSLSEIAENAGISRQGVRDVIVRAEAYMTEIEDKTGLIRRFLQMRQHLEAIESAASEIKTINYRQYEDPRLQELSKQISAAAAALKE